MKCQWLRTGLLFTAALLAAVEASAQNAITDWNTIASRTVVINGGKGPAPSFVWLAYSSIAVYLRFLYFIFLRRRWHSTRSLSPR